MKKVLSIVLIMCLLISAMSFVGVNAEETTSWTDAFTIENSGGNATVDGAEAQVATTAVEDGKISVSLPKRNADTNARLYNFLNTNINTPNYYYDIEFSLNVKEVGHKNTTVQLDIYDWNSMQQLYLYFGAATPYLNLNGEVAEDASWTLNKEHVYRLVGKSNNLSLYVNGILKLSGITPKATGSYGAPHLSIVTNNGGTSDPSAISYELTSFASYTNEESAERDAANAAIAAAFNDADSWEESKALIASYKSELYITDEELAEAEEYSQEEIYSTLLGQEFSYPGAVAVAFREAVAARAEAEKWLETVEIVTSWSGEGSTDEQVATTSVGDGKVSIALPAKSTTSKRMWVNTNIPLKPAYAIDTEFTLNVKNMVSSSSSNIDIRVKNYAVTHKLLLFYGASTPFISFNGEKITLDSAMLDSEHTYRVVGNSNSASLYVDGIMVATDLAPSSSSVTTTPVLEVVMNNGSDSAPDPQALEITSYATYTATETAARNEADAAIAAEFSAAADAESYKALLNEYKDELYITDAELAEAEKLVQSELYQSLIGVTYTYPGAVASAFKAAVAEQKEAYKWLDKVTTSGDYVTIEDGAITFDLPSKAELGTESSITNSAKITNDSVNAYNFDISFKAQMSESADYIGLYFVQTNVLWNIQIARNVINCQTGSSWVQLEYDDLGTEAHTFRLMGTTSTNANAINSKNINLYIDGKFIGLLPSTGQGQQYSITFSLVNDAEERTTARIWDYKRNTAQNSEFAFTEGDNVLLKTYTPTATDETPSTSYVIWAAYDENNKMTSYAISDTITTKAMSMSVFNLTPPETFVPDYRVKAMCWSGYGSTFTPVFDALENITE